MSTIISEAHSRIAAATGVDPQPVDAVGIVGPGRVGTALARALGRAGTGVQIAGSGSASSISLIVEVVAPGARAVDAAAVADGVEVVFLAVPLNRIDTVDPTLFDGKILVDVMNYWEPVDGDLPRFARARNGTSSVVADLFPGARVVKAFNHIGYHDIDGDGLPISEDGRRAVGVAGDDNAAVATVMALVDQMGFDAVFVGHLNSGVKLEAGGPVFGVRLQREEFARRLAP